MADLDTFIEAMAKAAADAGLACKPERAHVQFIVEDEKNTVRRAPQITEPAQCAHTISVEAIKDLPDGQEASFAAEMIEAAAPSLR